MDGARMEQAWLVSAKGREEGERTLDVPDTSESWQVPGDGKPRTEDSHHGSIEGAKNLRKGRFAGKPDEATGASERRGRAKDKNGAQTLDLTVVFAQVRSGRPQGPESHPRSKGRGQPDRALTPEPESLKVRATAGCQRRPTACCESSGKRTATRRRWSRPWRGKHWYPVRWSRNLAWR
jgi:hypothetical protein